MKIVPKCHDGNTWSCGGVFNRRHRRLSFCTYCWSYNVDTYRDIGWILGEYKDREDMHLPPQERLQCWCGSYEVEKDCNGGFVACKGCQRQKEKDRGKKNAKSKTS